MSITGSEYSTKSKQSSVYQTNGKPLSPEALYKAKLKYGIYNNPTTTSIGVSNSSNASDTAALLANSTDLTIEPYKRTIATDAQTAAIFARKDTAPTRWSKDYIDHDAAKAAASAKSIKQIITPTDYTNSNAAAASVLSKDSKSFASSNLSSLYEFDAIRNGSKNSNTTLNIEKLSKASKERASTMINLRTNPEWDQSRSGIETTKDQSNLQNFAAVGALASQNSKNNQQIDHDLEAKQIYKNSLVDPKVLAMARLNADRTLKGINKYLGEKDLFYNPDFNKAAMEVALKHSEKRSISNDKVNLGGGLFMTQEELNSIAQKIVNPVLEDITKKAKIQREKDAEIAKKREEQIQAHRKFKMEQQVKKMEEKRLIEESKLQRRKELEDLKQEQKDEKLKLEQSKKDELSKHQEILNSKQKEEEFKRNELITTKQTEEERILNESEEAKKQRELELKSAQDERDLKLAPILEKLKIETDKLDVLNQEKLAIQDITDSQIKNTENAKDLLKISQDELLFSENQLIELKKLIEESTNESERLLKESELKKQESEVAIKKSNELEAKTILKHAEIEKEKSIVENERLKLELELENIKIEVLEHEKKIAEISPPNSKVESTESNKIITATGSVEIPKTSEISNNQSTKTINDVSGVITPEVTTTKTTNTVQEGDDELKKTFTGFSQGSDEGDKNKSFFKEEF